LKEAFKFYNKACRLKDDVGCKNIGNLYFYGRGVRKNLRKALTYYKNACELKNKEACDSLTKIELKNRMGL